jgi:hypothetical protein
MPLRNFTTLSSALPSGIPFRTASNVSTALALAACRMACAAAASLLHEPSASILPAAVYAEISRVLALSRRSNIPANANCADTNGNFAFLDESPLLACCAKLTAFSSPSIAPSYNAFTFSLDSRNALAESRADVL